MKRQRQQALLELVQSRAVQSQAELVQLLAERGIQADQATVSRDIKALGLVRVPDEAHGHRYVVPGGVPRRGSWDGVRRIIRELVVKVDGNDSLLMLKTPSGAAHMVGVALDSVDDSDIVGTVAGDDTLLLVPRNKSARQRLWDRLQNMLDRA